MSMQLLNQLVARSIIDPSVVQSFNDGQIGRILAEVGFNGEMGTRLSSLKANTFTEYAVLAYRVVKAEEEARIASMLPSPADGLLIDSQNRAEEQVA
jgi:hypothetical protein